MPELALARRLRQRFEEDMHLLDQIGWEPKGKREMYAITLASEEIRSVFGVCWPWRSRSLMSGREGSPGAQGGGDGGRDIQSRPE
jgi:hypothetical protein